MYRRENKNAHRIAASPHQQSSYPTTATRSSSETGFGRSKRSGYVELAVPRRRRSIEWFPSVQIIVNDTSMIIILNFAVSSYRNSTCSIQCCGTQDCCDSRVTTTRFTVLTLLQETYGSLLLSHEFLSCFFASELRFLLAVYYPTTSWEERYDTHYNHNRRTIMDDHCSCWTLRSRVLV